MLSQLNSQTQQLPKPVATSSSLQLMHEALLSWGCKDAAAICLFKAREDPGTKSSIPISCTLSYEEFSAKISYLHRRAGAGGGRSAPREAAFHHGHAQPESINLSSWDGTRDLGPLQPMGPARVAWPARGEDRLEQKHLSCLKKLRPPLCFHI